MCVLVSVRIYFLGLNHILVYYVSWYFQSEPVFTVYIECTDDIPEYDLQ